MDWSARSGWSLHKLCLCCFCLSARPCGTNTAESLLFARFSWRIWQIITLLLCKESSTKFRVIWVSTHQFTNFATFAGFAEVDGNPLLGSSILCVLQPFSQVLNKTSSLLAASWQQRQTKLMHRAATDNLTELECSFYQLLVVKLWINRNQLQWFMCQIILVPYYQPQTFSVWWCMSCTRWLNQLSFINFEWERLWTSLSWKPVNNYWTQICCYIWHL